MNAHALAAPDRSSASAGPGLDALLARVGDARRLTPDVAARILDEAELEAEDLLAWSDFRHPVRDSYGRRLVARGARFELMVMSWLPGDYSAIHDHGSTEWGAVRYFGPADHVVFSARRGPSARMSRLEIETRCSMSTGSVCPVDHDLLHLMGNAGTQPFVSLHLYGLERPSKCVTGDARIFDLFERRIQRTDGGVFYCLPEAEISRREPAPEADPRTTLLHHRLMLARLERIASAGEGDASATRRARLLRAEIELLESGGRPLRP